MRIGRIEIQNFRAFKGVQTTIDLKNGKNLLVYGENGSGKTSLFNALKNFLECNARKHDITKPPIRNLFDDVTDPFVRLEFVDDPDHAGLYEWSETKNETDRPFIIQANTVKGFIDYKALLRTYFLQQERNSVDIFDLMVEDILGAILNPATNQPFRDEWREITAFAQKRDQASLDRLGQAIADFNLGMETTLKALKKDVGAVLRVFGFRIRVGFRFRKVRYLPRRRQLNKHALELSVRFFNRTETNHHHFLNEAKLSAIAISIFFAGLLQQPPTKVRLLALDDVLIGLDMMNRLPVLTILEKYFSDWQVFFFTYDRAWYHVVKQRLESGKNVGKWHFAEFFAAETDEGEIPVFADERKYLDRSKDHLNANDHKAAAMYLRSHFEYQIERFCQKKRVPVRLSDRSLSSEDYWWAIKTETSRKLADGKPEWDSQLTQSLITDVEQFRTIVLNELSHSTVANFHPTEVRNAIPVIERLVQALSRMR